MNKHLGYLGIDQHGQTYKLTKPRAPRKQLAAKLGVQSGSLRKMYMETKDGSSRHCGYIAQGLWISLYRVLPL